MVCRSGQKEEDLARAYKKCKFYNAKMVKYFDNDDSVHDGLVAPKQQTLRLQ